MLSQAEAHRIGLQWRKKKKKIGFALELEGWEENVSALKQGVQMQTQVNWHG